MTRSAPQALLLCPHCVAPIESTEDFCPTCGGPVTSYASIDPMGQIYATGYAYRQAVSGRPRTIVLLGMWLIFGPQLLGAAAFLIVMLSGPGRGFSIERMDAGSPFWLFTLGIVVGMIALYGLILAKVTARYWAASPEPGADDAAADSA